jgi:hypothetical protein
MGKVTPHLIHARDEKHGVELTLVLHSWRDA